MDPGVRRDDVLRAVKKRARMNARPLTIRGPTSYHLYDADNTALRRAPYQQSPRPRHVET